MKISEVVNMITEKCQTPRIFHTERDIPTNMNIGLERYSFTNITVKKGQNRKQCDEQNFKVFNMVELRELHHAIVYCEKYPQRNR